MDADHLTIEIVTPTSQYLENEVEYLRAPGVDGLFGVMVGHVPAIIALDSGEIAIDQNGSRKYLATSGGYAEIHRDEVTLIVETAELANEIDVERARAAAERAKDRLSREEGVDVIRAQAALERANNRLQVAGRR